MSSLSILIEHARDLGVTLGQLLDDVLVLLLVDLFLEVFVTETFTPELARFGQSRGRGSFFAIEEKRSFPVNSNFSFLSSSNT